MNVRLIVPRRVDGGHRDRLWAYCRAFWAEQRPGWEIVEGEHADGPFNRSAAINAAAATGDWDIAVILDSDTILDADLVERGIERAAETGRLTLPFKVRNLLSRPGTMEVLRGAGGSWDRFVGARQTPDDAYEFISSCQIVPRALWDDVGGFDERFEGWGGEDDAFHAACVALSGQDPREDRLDGACWHLWHPISPHASHQAVTWRMAKALSDRYVSASEDWNAMRALLAEDRGSDQVLIVVLTTLTRDTLEPTLDSIDEQVRGPIGRKLICVDQERAPFEREGWDVVAMGKPQGYVKATRNLHGYAVASGQPWVLHTEDDFTFNEPVDLRGMQALMEAHPELVQMSLMRQPWYEHERAAGGVIEANPEAFTQADGYVEHRAYYTSNPNLCRRAFLAEHEFPGAPNSELRFGRQIFRDPHLKAGILGQIGDPPRVHHIGQERAGHGY
jgi:hypothetical protein